MAWENITKARKNLLQVLLFFLLPLILLSLGGEMAGMVYLGKRQAFQETVKLPVTQTVAYGACRFVLSLLVVFVGAKAVKYIAQTFHERHTYSQCFTVVAYGLSPLFLLRLLDALPAMNPWASFGIGMALCLATLYHGFPRVLQPDPPHALGLYFVSILILSGVAGVARFLTWLLLTGKIKLS